MPTGAFVAVRNGVAFPTGNSGFPKSQNVSKAIDKARDEDLQPAADVAKWLCDQMEQRGVTRAQVSEYFGAANIAQQWTTHWTDGAAKPRVPRVDQWAKLKAWLKLPDDMDSEVWRLNGNKGQPGENFKKGEVVGKREVLDIRNGHGREYGSAMYAGEKTGKIKVDITAPATDAARQWEGWGTALKPAHEPIVMARKPLAGTVAANVLEHGTGALNIDGCRVESDGEHKRSFQPTNNGRSVYGKQAGFEPTNAEGRFPTNLIHDGSDEATGGMGDCQRYFYCAKANKRDRGEGNKHPTVKPTELMRYLCRLVTPPGGVVLDPFMGSGSTGKAAMLEGFEFIGIELDPDYFAIAENRIQEAGQQVTP